MLIERGSLDITDLPQNSPRSQITIVVQSPSGTVRPATYELAPIRLAQDGSRAELALATGHGQDPGRDLTRYGRLRLWIRRTRVPTRKLYYVILFLALPVAGLGGYVLHQTGGR